MALMTSARLGGVLFLILCIAYGVYAGDITLDYWSEQEMFNARSMPYLIAIAWSFCAILLIVIPTPKTDWSTALNLNWLPAGLLLVLMSAYGFLLEPLGFVIATILFLVTAFLVLGVQSVRAPLLVAATIAMGFWLLMDKLGIYLAPGVLPEQLFQYLGVAG